ncbi:MAG: S49 family peptidase, partial [Lentisphaerae bacterium]
MQKDVTTAQRSPLWMKLLAGLVCVLLLNGCISPRVEIPGLSPPQVTVCEIARDGTWPRQVIAVLPLCGEIRSDESLLWPGITSRYAGTVLAEIKRYSQVKALVLQIDSPGGSVHATDRIYHLIEAYHKQTGVPVYAVITGIGASGAYYVACAAQEIFAEPTSVVGSIGVIMRIPLLKDLADKVGYRETIIKSGASKDMG